MATVPPKVEAGARDLAKRDPVLKAALKVHGVPDLKRARPAKTHFAELAWSICYQQLAGRAVAAIHGRFAALFDGPPTPEAVLALSMEELRSVGLSGSKAASIVDLAEKVDAGLVELDRMNRLPDEVVVKELVLVRGIGEWTADMFLMFQLGRLDIWPTGDYGVRNGYSRTYDLPEMLTPKVLEAEGEQFRPYRSIVACWCWRACRRHRPPRLGKGVDAVRALGPCDIALRRCRSTCTPLIRGRRSRRREARCNQSVERTLFRKRTCRPPR